MLPVLGVRQAVFVGLSDSGVWIRESRHLSRDKQGLLFSWVFYSCVHVTHNNRQTGLIWEKAPGGSSCADRRKCNCLRSQRQCPSSVLVVRICRFGIEGASTQSCVVGRTGPFVLWIRQWLLTMENRNSKQCYIHLPPPERVPQDALI